MTDALLSVLKRLPPQILQAVVRGEQTFGTISEVRIRAGRPLCLTTIEGGFNRRTSLVTDSIMVAQAVAALCDHSLHAHMDTIREGYISVEGGIRVGVAGRAVCEGGKLCSITDIGSLCIRVPALVGRTDRCLLDRLKKGCFRESVLFYSPPGVGKTTVLRNLAYTLAEEIGLRVAVIDTRLELYADALAQANNVDMYSGYPKGIAIELATRTMNPQYIVCDEIGSLEEAKELWEVENTGVPLLASAHAQSVAELLSRPNIRLLHRSGVFDCYVGLSRQGGTMGYHYTMREECLKEERV